MKCETDGTNARTNALDNVRLPVSTATVIFKERERELSQGKKKAEAHQMENCPEKEEQGIFVSRIGSSMSSPSMEPSSV